MSDQPPPVSPGHKYRDHLVVTKHRSQELDLEQDGKPTTGAHLIRPYPEARVMFIDHQSGWYYVYWIDQRLMVPRSDL